MEFDLVRVYYTVKKIARAHGRTNVSRGHVIWALRHAADQGLASAEDVEAVYRSGTNAEVCEAFGLKTTFDLQILLTYYGVEPKRRGTGGTNQAGLTRGHAADRREFNEDGTQVLAGGPVRRTA